MDEALKAEHCVLPCNEMQDCADARGMVEVSAVIARRLGEGIVVGQ